MMFKRSFRSILFTAGIILALLLVSLQPAFAKGQFAKITIQTVDSASQPIDVNDSAFLNFWTFSDFTNGTKEAPTIVGPAYEVTRWYQAEDGTFVAWDRLRYYHTSEQNTDGRGWIFYEGLVNGGSEYDGKWFVATRNADALMESIIFAEPSANLATVETTPMLGMVGTLSLWAFILTVWIFQQR